MPSPSGSIFRRSPGRRSPSAGVGWREVGRAIVEGLSDALELEATSCTLKPLAKQYLEPYQSEPLPERGGMSRRYFRVTPKGLEALEEARRVHDKLWKGLPKLYLRTK